MTLSSLIIAHLVGDFLLQNDWMQRKTVSSFVCSVHIAAYSVPFIMLVLAGRLEAWMLLCILTQHWLQDRFSLHRYWMTFFRQTPPDKWPIGPLCMDQSFHLAFIGLLCAL